MTRLALSVAGAVLVVATDTLTERKSHPGARELLFRREANGDGGMEALRILKRRLSVVVFHTIIPDHESANH
ncbi:hypothetical protein [Nocardia sp. NPDC047038]|uniref:hypothetical protein n=1 Tax=Nocardia sp. NPDC047038 TaxID=3154338 RepID=UPI0033F37DA5